MIPEQELYSQAISSLQADELSKAREVFSQLLKIDRKNVNYWLWMSAAVETSKERIYCLREVLVLEPDNQEAALGLRMLGEKTPALQSSAPADPPFIPWKTSLELAAEQSHGPRGLRSSIAIYSLLGIIILTIFGFGIYQALNPPKAANPSPIKHWTITPLPTETETPIPTATSTGPAAYSIILDVTFTPTPIYVATPHNRVEAYNAGMHAYEKGDWAGAIEYFKQVLAIEPDDADVYYHLGDVYRFQGDYANAQSAYQSAVKIAPNFAPAYLGEAQVDLYGSPAKIEAASVTLKKAISLDPQLMQAYFELANLSLQQNNPDAALDWLAKLDSSNPNNAVVELDRAKAYLTKGNLDEALAAVKKANAFDRSLIPVYQVWAQVLQANGDFADSIRPLLTVLTNSPTNISSQILLARAYYESGDSVKALAMVNDSLQTNNKSIEAFLLRADIELDSGNTVSARADFNAVLRIDYNNFDGNLGIGRVQLAEDLAGSAYNDFDYTQKFAVTDVQKAILIYWHAVAHLGLNQIDPAITDFEAALDYSGNPLPYKLRMNAQKQLALLYTSTPSPLPTLTETASPTSTITPTVLPTQK
jgi:tetratricopeptide (TPR) repeat protein